MLKRAEYCIDNLHQFLLHSAVNAADNISVALIELHGNVLSADGLPIPAVSDNA